MSTKYFRTRQAPSPTGYLHLGTARTVLFTKLISVINNGIWYLRVEDTDRNRLQSGAVTNLLEALSELGLNADEGVTLLNQEVKNSNVISNEVRDLKNASTQDLRVISIHSKVFNEAKPSLSREVSDRTEGNSYNTFYNVYQVGEFGPYIQSERLAIYQEHAQKLIDLKLAYWSYITTEEKEELVQIKNVTKKPINYLKENLQRHPEKQESLYQSVEEGLTDDQKPVLLYKIQRDEKIKCFDELLGESQFDLNLEEDFGILKSDGYPTYHLAHLVDDFLMQTSLVIRAQEWFPSIPKHVTMFRDYWGNEAVIASSGTLAVPSDVVPSKNGQNVPAYLHLPFILGEIGNKKMSKRDGNVNMQDYLDKGFLPEAIVNYLAFLGWNPGTDKELYLQKEDFLNLNQKQRLAKLISNISQDFSLETLSKSPARFNLQKLEWFNKEYLKMLSLEEFVQRSLENKITRSINLTNLETQALENRKNKLAPTENIQKQYLAWNLDKNRITTLSEFGIDSDCILNYSKPNLEIVKWKKSSIEESLANLDEIKEVISSLYVKFEVQQNELYEAIFNPDFEEKFNLATNFWETEIKKWLTENQKQVGNYLWPLRVCLSGKEKSPSPFELLAILKKDEALGRIKKVVE